MDKDIKDFKLKFLYNLQEEDCLLGVEAGVYEEGFKIESKNFGR